jgi:hypothetical protein
VSDVARDPAALELLRLQRSRLADRMRPPWWYLTGGAIVWALVFALPFASRYLPQGFGIWPFLVAGLAVALPLQGAWPGPPAYRWASRTSPIARAAPHGSRCLW